MARILHFADCHFSEFRTLAGMPIRDVRGGSVLGWDTCAAMLAVLHKASDSGPLDGIVVAGDVFDKPRPTPSDVQQAASIMRLLAGECAAGKVLVLSGNHDTTRNVKDASAVMSVGLADYVRAVDQDEVLEYAGLTWRGVPYPRRAAYTGVDCPPEANSNDFWSNHLNQTVGEDASRDRVLLYHGTIAGARVGAQPRALDGDIQLSAEVASGYAAAMAGHIHQQQEVGKRGSNIYYSGSPLVQDFGEEGEPKGGILWTFEDTVQATPLQVPGRLWRTLGVASEEFDAKRDALVKCLANADEGDGSIFRVVGVLPYQQAAAVREVIRDASRRGLWVADRLEVVHGDRVRREMSEEVSDTMMVREALSAREIPDEEIAGIMALHPEVEEAMDS